MFILHLIPIPFFALSLLMTHVYRKALVQSDADLAEAKNGGDPEAVKKAEANQKGYQNLFGTFQPLTTIIILFVAVTSFFSPTGNTFFSICIVAGMLLSTRADFSIVDLSDSSAFVTGIIFFCLANIAYGIGLTGLNGFQLQDIFPLLAGLILCAGISIGFWPSLKLGKPQNEKETKKAPPQKEDMTLKIGMVFFCLVFCYIIARSLILFDAPGFSPIQAILLTTGLTVYFYGDLRLATRQFISLNLPLSTGPLPLTSGPWTYGIGQLLIALSASYFPGN